tara:strand:- start:1762 stop:1986 length:225 start_codon:yes stop_codon:yes gene_type:complete
MPCAACSRTKTISESNFNNIDRSNLSSQQNIKLFSSSLLTSKKKLLFTPNINSKLNTKMKLNNVSNNNFRKLQF